MRLPIRRRGATESPPRVWGNLFGILALTTGLLLGIAPAPKTARADEPDSASYWAIDEVRPGMRGHGLTVMRGTQLERFEAEVLGVQRGVAAGRDVILCRLDGLNLNHSGIIQGMSGSPIYIDDKLLGAVAFTWEFAKDPIAGVTPFSQMVQYARPADRRFAARHLDAEIPPDALAQHDVSRPIHGNLRRLDVEPLMVLDPILHREWSSRRGVNGLGWLDPSDLRPGNRTVGASRGRTGWSPIGLPVALSGFGDAALEAIAGRLEPRGLAPIANGAAPQWLIDQHGRTPIRPGSPVSVGLVIGDFDISAIGTVTHVEGDRVYAFGHPMYDLGDCDLPMMTSYIHTVYPRSSVGMKMGSPLRVIGTIDADVSTGIAGRVGAVPDLLPMTVTVDRGVFSEPQTYRVQIVRHRSLMSDMIHAVLTGALGTEGRLPRGMTAQITTEIVLEGRDEPILLEETKSGTNFNGSLGMTTLVSSVGHAVKLIGHNTVDPVRIREVRCRIAIQPGLSGAQIARIEPLTTRVEPGQTVRVRVHLEPQRDDPVPLTIRIPIPEDFPTGTYEATVCDQRTSMRRLLENDPGAAEPRERERFWESIAHQTSMRRTSLYVHLRKPGTGVALGDRRLDDLPSSVLTVFKARRGGAPPKLNADLVISQPTDYVIDGSRRVRFDVVDSTGLSYNFARNGDELAAR